MILPPWLTKRLSSVSGRASIWSSDHSTHGLGLVGRSHSSVDNIWSKWRSGLHMPIKVDLDLITKILKDSGFLNNVGYPISTGFTSLSNES
jgi:hypothetical protein